MSQSNLLAIGQLIAIKIQTSSKEIKIFIILFLMIIRKEKKEEEERTKLIIFFKKLFDLVFK